MIAAADDDSERWFGVRPQVSLSLIEAVVVAIELFGVVVVHLMRDLEKKVGQLRGGLVAELTRTPMTVHLQTFKLRERDYGSSKNPPILHRKETFLTSDHPLHAKFSRLTRQEEAKGLFEDTARIGTREGWRHALANKGVRLREHRLIRVSAG